jgi:hypothetical protein
MHRPDATDFITLYFNVLRPELIPGVEVVEMFLTVKNATVFELEDKAAVNIQLLAVSRRTVVVDSDHATVGVRKDTLQCGLERSSCLASIPAKLGEDRIAAVVVAGKGTSPRRVPRCILVEQLGECFHIGRVESSVSALHGLGVSFCFAHDEISFPV